MARHQLGNVEIMPAATAPATGGEAAARFGRVGEGFEGEACMG